MTDINDIINEVRKRKLEIAKRTLFIDLDSKKLPYSFLFRFRKLFINLWAYKGIEIEDIKVWETKKGIHIKITLNKSLNFETILLLQVLLDDDKVRTTYNYTRYISNNMTNFNFFSKGKRIIKVDWENKKKEIIYESREEITKLSNKILRKLVSEWDKIKKGKRREYLAKYN